MSTFSDLRGALIAQITEWRKRKTKVVGDDECAFAAKEYDTEIAKFMISFISAAKEAYRMLASNLFLLFRAQYAKQGLDVEYIPNDVVLAPAATCQSISLSEEFIALKEITYEEQKYDLMSLFRLSGTKEEKELVRVATCYYSQWRDKATQQIMPLVDEFIGKNIAQLSDYYNALAEAFHRHLSELTSIQEAEKSKVSAQLSDDERKLQEDNDWLTKFKEQLIHIERG